MGAANRTAVTERFREGRPLRKEKRKAGVPRPWVHHWASIHTALQEQTHIEE